jgi:S-adenosylhomocysteine hydrolase
MEAPSSIFLSCEYLLLNFHWPRFDDVTECNCTLVFRLCQFLKNPNYQNNISIFDSMLKSKIGRQYGSISSALFAISKKRNMV